MNLAKISVTKLPTHWAVLTPAGWGIVKDRAVEDGLLGVAYKDFDTWPEAIAFVVSAIDERRVKPFKRGHRMRVAS